MNEIIHLSNVSLSYNIHHSLFKRKTINALNNISFTVKKGEMVSIIGFNGSGKTTLLSIIADILKPDSGLIIVQGRVVPFLGLGIGFNPELTAEENVYLYGVLMGLNRDIIKKNYHSIVEFAELEKFMDLKIKEFSSGMYVRLGFAVAIHTAPDILIIDEVLAVGDISFQRKCLDKIQFLKKMNKTILFVSHDMGLVSRFSDRVILLDKGKLIMDGNPVNVIDKYMHLRKMVPVFESHRRGSGEIIIKSFNLNKKDNMYKKGEKMEINLEYEKHADIKQAIVGFAVYSQNGDLISGPNIYDSDKCFLQIKEKGNVIMGFETSHLNPGKYYLSIAFYDKTNRFAYDHIDYALMFEIIGDNKEYAGYIDLNPYWKE